MHAHRPADDRLPLAEPMRADEIRRMLDDERRPRAVDGDRRRHLKRLVIRLAIVFAVYALSIGPMYWRWFGAKCGLDSPIYLVIYRPLENLANWIPPLGWLLNWYISLWIL